MLLDSKKKKTEHQVFLKTITYANVGVIYMHANFVRRRSVYTLCKKTCLVLTILLDRVLNFLFFPRRKVCSISMNIYKNMKDSN